MRCTIGEFSLNECPPFEALSYEWGPAEPRHILIVDETHGVWIRRNLAVALMLLRWRNVDRHIWIDAVCINQGDLEERASQVQRMHRIYSSATEVIMFLGLDKGEIFEIFKAIAEIRQHFVQTFQPFLNVREDVSASLDARHRGEIEAASSAPPDTVFATAHKLWNLSYFTRMWIFQEVVSAKSARMICGDWSLPWSTVEGYLQADYMVSSTRSQGLRSTSYKGISPHAISDTRIAIALGSELWPASRLHLIHMLQATRQLQATEPSDKVFAVLGVATDNIPRILKPDYTPPWQTVYTRAAQVTIENSGTLQILEDVEVKDKASGLPSWVPNWQTFPAIRSGFAGVDYMHHSADGGIDVKLRDVGDPAVLAVQGLRLGAIQSTGHCPSTNYNGPGDFASLHDIFLAELELANAASVDSGPLYQKTQEPIKLAYTRTRFCDEFPKLPPNESSSKFRDISNGEVRWPELSEELFSPSGSAIDREVHGPFLQQCSDKLFFTTANGHMGMAAPVVKPDDTVYALLGSRFEVVLRPVKDKDAFTFVCLCYLHGFMHGEDVRLLVEKIADLAPQDRIMVGAVDGFIEIQELSPTTRLEYVNLI